MEDLGSVSAERVIRMTRMTLEDPTEGVIRMTRMTRMTPYIWKNLHGSDDPDDPDDPDGGGHPDDPDDPDDPLYLEEPRWVG